ncbi:polysaccharide pyruvyl transferase family protein [Geothrix paludis]|uniref:polysaccharide pyruvyl transferase family protein n=1 Tax=Geothrix paludis TaxID=2922722 RepID=UPI001FADAE62|nr:polysaccharide pyruvyl transferase family protein [Geothrix paludis]
MIYGLLGYHHPSTTYNLGDYIQSLAAKQFLPSVDRLINREELGAYSGDPIAMILNGWFTHNHQNWIPSKTIQPLFTSFHINSSAAAGILSHTGIAYLKEHQPIGCRDHHTRDLLQSVGIEAYFSGCLTLTLDSYRGNPSERTEEIYLVDPFFSLPTLASCFSSPRSLVRHILQGDLPRLGLGQRLLDRIFPATFLASSRVLHHVLPAAKTTQEDRFTLAETYLSRYAKARLVITSRIHAALPCLALGTPVIFLNYFPSEVDHCRFDGLIDLFHRIDIHPDGGYEATFDLQALLQRGIVPENPTTHEAWAESLKTTCRAFISSVA